MELDKLAKIIVEGNKRLKKADQIQLEDGSFEFDHVKGLWAYNHNVMQGESGFGGRETVYYKEDPVWLLSFFAKYDESFDDQAQYFLKQVLEEGADKFPFRGPMAAVAGGFQYINRYTGDIEQFTGLERVYRNDKGIYEARYMGGLIN